MYAIFRSIDNKIWELHKGWFLDLEDCQDIYAKEKEKNPQILLKICQLDVITN